MAISIGDALLKLGVDSKGLDKGMKNAETNVKTASQKMQKSLMIAGAAFTAVGVAGLKLVDSARKMNAQLGVIALNLGITTKEMRNLALETTNVTFPLKEVISTFDLLARAGIEDTKVLKDLATFFDTLGDAIGLPASVVTTKMIPAMKTFNFTAEEMAEKGDALTWLFKNTIVSMDAFNAMIGYVSPEMVAMGFTMDDMIKIMALLEEQGYAGELMMRKWRTATGEATRENKSIYDVLGITTEQMEPYEEALKGITGMTEKYAEVANLQYGIMDKLRQKWSELTLQYGTFLQPLEPILATMTALGPMMMIFSTVLLPKLTFATIAHTIAMVGQKIGLIALNVALGITVGLVVALTAGLALLSFGIWKVIEVQRQQAKIQELNIRLAEEHARALAGEANEYREALLAAEAYGYQLTEQQKDYIKVTEASEETMGAKIALANAEAVLGAQSQITGQIMREEAQLVAEGWTEAAAKIITEWRKVLAWTTPFGVGGVRGRTYPYGEPYPAGYPYPTPGAPVPPPPGAPPRYGPEFWGMEGGGIAMRPMLARIGEQAPRIPEVVAPLDKLQAMLGGSRMVNIYVELDGRIIARAIGQPLVEDIRLRTGVHI